MRYGDTLETRVKDLEAALRHQRQLTEYERRRARALEEQAAIAWRVTQGHRPRVESK